MGTNLIDSVFNAYAEIRLWSRVAKRHYFWRRIPLLRRRRFNWEKIMTRWLMEFDYVAVNYRCSPLFAMTLESAFEFIERLTAALAFAHRITDQERRSAVEALKEGKAPPRPQDELAQALFVKAFLEISRARPWHGNHTTFYCWPRYIRTVSEIISRPLLEPLPHDHSEKADGDAFEYHLPLRFGQDGFEYERGLRQLALGYPTIAEGYEALKQKAGLTAAEQAVLKLYPEFRDRIHQRY